MEKRPCLFFALPHVPLDGVDDAQEPKTYRPEVILAVHDLAERFGPVHKGIVIGRYEYRFRSKAQLSPADDSSIYPAIAYA